MLRIVLLIPILALFGDCMDNGKRKAGGISIDEQSEYGIKEKKVVATSEKGKEKLGEISVMDTIEHIAQMDIAQDKDKMDICVKPKHTEQETPTISLKCADDVEVEVELDRNIFRFSTTLDTMMEDLEMYNAEGKKQKLPVSNVSSTVMRKVIEWCEHHRNDPSIEPIYEEIDLDVPTGKDAEASTSNVQEGEVAEESASKAKPKEPANIEKRLVFPSWDDKFLDKEWPELAEIILAANYLNIKLLLTFATTMVYNKWVKGKRPEEIRKTFGVEEPYPPEHPEWKRVEKENEWEESDEEREARHAKEREEEEERERKEEQKNKEKLAEGLRQEQLQQQNQQQEHQLGQEHDEGQEHYEDMTDD
ncbi:hypothetical protein niasHT_012178 [Heterodera trifolii]|uniref:Uncharacterized protein n=1 Tax=Heterodera trifolii TaxID=157864 RepID=A0ABD2KU18_9BILA